MWKEFNLSKYFFCEFFVVIYFELVFKLFVLGMLVIYIWILVILRDFCSKLYCK